MLKRVLFSLLVVCLTLATQAQTASQLQQMQNLTPQQLEILTKSQGLGSGSNSGGLVLPGSNNGIGTSTVFKNGQKFVDTKTNKILPLGERSAAERKWNAGSDSTSRTSLGREPLPSKYDKLWTKMGDSILITTQEYIELKMRSDKDSVKVFGRDIFNKKNLTFAPSMTIATPPNYVLNAGDEVIVTVWGAAEGSYSLVVTPEGNIAIPSVGLIHVGGLTVAQAETRIKQKFAGAVSGLSDGSVHIKVTLGDIRSIKVNIVGEAFAPGTYTLPSLATLFNALYSAGGTTDVGSVRDIKLYRGGKQIAALDVYDYLLKGKMEVNMQLEDGDMIVVEPYANIVEITGKVRRPMKYELKKGEKMASLLQLAGDFAGDAYTGNVAVARRSGGRQFSMHTVGGPEFEAFVLADRDSVAVGEILQTYANKVSIQGAVWREGDYELSQRIKTVGDLLRVAEGLRDDAFAGRAQVVRTRPDRTLQVIPINAGKILLGEATDIDLLKDDKVIVTSIEDLKEAQTIGVKGEVNDPRTIPYAAGMTIEDLIVLTKGLRESASLARIEVARRVKSPHSTNPSSKRAELFQFTIPEDLALTEAVANFTLEPFDEVYIRRSPGYSEQQDVFIGGEVAFQGEYTLPTAASRLTDLVQMAGGLTPEAYVKGASLERAMTAFDIQRQKSLVELWNRNQQANKGDTMSVKKMKVGDFYPIGIDLNSAMLDPSSSFNIVLKKGDRLVIPTQNSIVSISGAVYYPNTTTYDPKFSMGDYIAAAGGYIPHARRKPFIIYMNGTVTSKACAKIEPGCEIVVPSKQAPERMNVQGWIGISSSIVSMAAMVVSLLNK